MVVVTAHSTLVGDKYIKIFEGVPAGGVCTNWSPLFLSVFSTILTSHLNN